MLLVEQAPVRKRLAGMVRNLTADLSLREDLLQEALLHLWLTECARAGQTWSWYLQSCKWKVLNLLGAGRSVDAGKRRAGQVDESPEAAETFFSDISARDLLSLLIPRLRPQAKKVLECFAGGFGVRETGRALKISHPMVIKHRKEIAELLESLS